MIAVLVVLSVPSPAPAEVTAPFQLVKSTEDVGVDLHAREVAAPERDLVSEAIEYGVRDNQVDAVLGEQESIDIVSELIEYGIGENQVDAVLEEQFINTSQADDDVLPVQIVAQPIKVVHIFTKKEPTIQPFTEDNADNAQVTTELLEVNEEIGIGVFATSLRQKPGSAELTQGAYKRFFFFVEQAKIFPRALIVVRGYVASDTDSVENRELSHKRAKQVQTLLVNEGLPAERIEVLGMGIQDPIASNSTPAGRYKNRRVEVELATDELILNEEENE